MPGLGTNPQECWTWTASDREDGKRSKTTNSSATPDPFNVHQPTAEPRRQFNWLRDADGLASLFPKSRIMLYDYASAWIGRRKVRATMKSISTWLLDDLKEKRKVCASCTVPCRSAKTDTSKGGTEITRPLIMIGHSMGGIVIVKVWRTSSV